jgi:hypothetical protein
VEGNGKTFFSKCVARAVGERYSHWPKAKEIDNKFNKWLVGSNSPTSTVIAPGFVARQHLI